MNGHQNARIELIPDGEEHPRWGEVADFLKALGYELDPWQLRVLWASLLRRGDMWASFAIGVCVPRQNGKTLLLEAREFVGAYLLGERLQVHTAHLADTSKEAFRRLEDVLEANEWFSKDLKHIWRTNGHEALEFRNGCRIRFRTRTRGGGRGFSASPVYFDEAMFLDEVSLGSILPVMSAQPDPQVWYLGSAVDQQIHEDGVVFTRQRENALAKTDRLAYFEWSLDYQTPDDVPLDALDSEEALAEANPAFGVRITRDYVREELKGLDHRTAAVERGGVGDWPRTDGLSTIIDLELWASLADLNSVPGRPLVYAFDIRPDRSRGVIAAVGRNAAGKLHVEIGEHREGTNWMIDRLEDLYQRQEPLAIVCDSVGPAASLVPQLLARQVLVQPMQTPEVAEACGMFYDAVHHHEVAHRDQPELLQAIKGAVQRPLGERWAWSRRNSTSDVSPLVASTLAVGSLIANEMAEPWAA